MVDLRYVATLVGGPSGYDRTISDLSVISVGGQARLYAASMVGGGLAGWDVAGEGGTLLGAQPYVRLMRYLATPSLIDLSRGDEVHLLVPGVQLSAAGAYELTDTGAFGRVRALPGALALPVDMVAAARAEIGGQSYLYAVRHGSSAVLTFAVADDLTPQQVAGPSATAAPPPADLRVVGVDAMAVAHSGGAAFLLMVQAAGNRISSHALGSDGRPVLVQALGMDSGIGFANPGAVEVAQVGGATYAVVAAAGSSSLTVFRVEPDGRLRAVDHVIDSLPTRFQAVDALAVVAAGERVFVVAGGGDDGISLFALLPGGHLLHLASLEDTLAASLADVGSLAAHWDGARGVVKIFAASGSEAGIAQLAFEPGPGVVLAGAALTGGAGNDILVAGTAAAVMVGGAGQDCFVLSANGQVNRILDYLPGHDWLDLSMVPMLRSFAQVAITATATGVRIGFGTTVVEVTSALGVPIPVSHFQESVLLGLTRFVPGGVPLILTGSAGDDRIDGQYTGDRLYGGAGADTVYGDGGDDRAVAGAGDDLVFGADGFDTLFGDDGADDLSGEADDDLIYGGAGDDSLRGGDWADVLYGGDDRDRLDGGAGDDSAYGGAGNDVMLGVAGRDRLSGGTGRDAGYGGDGDDALLGGMSADTLYGGAGADLVQGDGGGDRVFGGAGDDGLDGGSGHDRISGGTGADTVTGGDHDDTLTGDDDDDDLAGDGGDDWLAGDDGSDRLAAGEGADRAYGGWGRDLIDGGAGDDTLSGGGDADRLIAGPGDDLIYGGAGRDVVSGGDGRQVVFGGDGQDAVYAGGGADDLRGGRLSDTLYGGEGDDRVQGDDGNEMAYGGGGDDLMLGGDGRDRLRGGDGADDVQGEADDDALTGDAGDDRLYGGDGVDDVQGGTGDDRLRGGAGADLLAGGEGADTLIGDGGADVLAGDGGADLFVFLRPSDGGTGSLADRITDFEPGVDRLDLSAMALHGFIGSADFGGTAGEVRLGPGRIEIDLDGDRRADLDLWLTGAPGFGAGDLIL